MAKVGRNEPCPCGSGKKYKRCCLERLQAEERARRAARAAELRAARAAEEPLEEVALDVHDLIEAGELDAAQRVAEQASAEFPDDTRGAELLAEVFEARGEPGVAAEHYRRALSRMDDLGRGHYCDCCRARMVKAIRRLDPEGPAPALGTDPQ